MRTYTDTDREILCEVSCENCGDYYWRPNYGVYTCPDCVALKKAQRERSQRFKKIYKRPTQEAIRKAANIFNVIVEKKDDGIVQNEIMKILAARGFISYKNGSFDCLAMLDYTGHLVYIDNQGRLYPYKNMNTGERYG